MHLLNLDSGDKAVDLPDTCVEPVVHVEFIFECGGFGVEVL